MKIIGIGDHGAAVLSHLIRDPDILDICYYIDHAYQSQLSLPVGHYIPVVKRTSSYLLCRQMEKLAKGVQMILVVSGLQDGDDRRAAQLCRIAHEQGALTIAFISTTEETKTGCEKQIQRKLRQIYQYSDSCIILTDQNKNRTSCEKLMVQGVRALYELLANPLYINVDYADLYTVMGRQKHAFIKTGHGYGENRCQEAVQEAAVSDFIDVSLSKLSQAIVHIAGDPSLTLDEVNHVLELLKDEAGKELDIIFGMVIDEHLENEIIVTILAAGNEC